MAEVDLQKKIDGFLSSAFKKFIIRDYDNAVRDLKAAEVLDRENPEVLYNLGINYCRMGLYKTAVEYLQKLLTLKLTFIDASEVKKLLAYSLIHLTQYREADAYLDQVLDLFPSDVVAMNMKGYSLDIQGRHDEALRVYRSIVDVDEKNFNACNSIAYILARRGGDLKKSLSYARAAYESNRRSAAYLDTLGFVYLKMGDLEKAQQYLSAALHRSPLSEDIRGHIKELRKLQGIIDTC